MTARYDALIVGGGQGGGAAAMALRQHGFAGSIAIVGEEAEPPYERPPLSKEYLAGEKTWERLLLRAPEAWAERRIELLLGREVTGVDPHGKHVVTSGGDTIGYGQLIWAAGGHARRLSCEGHDLTGVHTVRTRADVDRLSAELPDVREAVVIGGGYIGLEAASVLSKFGKTVTVLEALDRVLARVAGEPLSRFYEAEHRAHGVDVRLGVAVASIHGEGDRVAGVRLADGELCPAQLVVVGVGIVPAVQPLADAGAECGNGVRVDAQCRTSLPDIFAIGDCAEHRSRFAGGDWIRLESVQNANDQAGVAAKTIAGKAAAHDTVPWFWSNQYDLKLQTVGLSRGADALALRGDPGTRAFTLGYFREGALIALDCVNTVRDYAQGRALVTAGTRVSAEAFADVARPLKELALS